MHEGKHGILDGVDDIDDIFGTKEDHEKDAGHDHDQKDKKKKDADKPHSHDGCNCSQG